MTFKNYTNTINMEYYWRKKKSEWDEKTLCL